MARMIVIPTYVTCKSYRGVSRSWQPHFFGGMQRATRLAFLCRVAIMGPQRLLNHVREIFGRGCAGDIFGDSADVLYIEGFHAAAYRFAAASAQPARAFGDHNAQGDRSRRWRCDQNVDQPLRWHSCDQFSRSGQQPGRSAVDPFQPRKIRISAGESPAAAIALSVPPASFATLGCRTIGSSADSAATCRITGQSSSPGTTTAHSP